MLFKHHFLQHQKIYHKQAQFYLLSDHYSNNNMKYYLLMKGIFNLKSNLNILLKNISSQNPLFLSTQLFVKVLLFLLNSLLNHLIFEHQPKLLILLMHKNLHLIPKNFNIYIQFDNFYFQIIVQRTLQHDIKIQNFQDV